MVCVARAVQSAKPGTDKDMRGGCSPLGPVWLPNSGRSGRRWPRRTVSAQGRPRGLSRVSVSADIPNERRISVRHAEMGRSHRLVYVCSCRGRAGSQYVAILDTLRRAAGDLQLLVGTGRWRFDYDPPRRGSLHERAGWLRGGPPTGMQRARQGELVHPRTGEPLGEDGSTWTATDGNLMEYHGGRWVSGTRRRLGRADRGGARLRAG